MPGEVDIKATTEHDSEFVGTMKDFRHQTMVAQQYFHEWREVLAAEGKLGTERDIGKTGVVDSRDYRESFTAAPMIAVIKSEPEPPVEIISCTGARASWIRFHTAAQREQSQRQLAGHIRRGIKTGISGVKLPLGGCLVLRFGHGAEREEKNDHC